MKVLVTGATGFIGREVLRQARAAGLDLRLLVRDPAAAPAGALAARFSAELHAGNVLDAASLDGAAGGCDAVIHLVGIISEIGAQTFENVHLRATQNVLAAVRTGGVRRFVHMSALGARPNAVSRYHQSKWAAEEAVRASGLDWTIFRPSLVFGPEDHFVNLFARMSRFSPVLPVIGPGRTRLQPIAVEDVAACFVRSLSQPASIARTFDLCGPEIFPLPQILNLVLEALGRRRLVLHVPLPLARFLAASLERVLPMILHQAPPLNRDQLLMLMEDNVGDATPAFTLFDIQPTGFKQGIRSYLGGSRDGG